MNATALTKMCPERRSGRMSPRPNSSSHNQPPINKHKTRPATAASVPRDGLTGQRTARALGTAALPHTLLPQAAAQGPGSCLRGGQTQTPQDGREGPQGGFSFLTGRSRLWGSWSLLPSMNIMGCLVPQQGRPLSFLQPAGLPVHPLYCSRSPGQGPGCRREGPLPTCRDPAGAANRLSSGSPGH